MKKLLRTLFVLCFLLSISIPLFAQVTETPNLGLNIVSPGTVNWGPLVNENFTILDTKVVTLNLNCSDGQVPTWSAGKFSICGSGGSGGGGHVIWGAVAFTPRSKLRFLGTPLTLADNAVNDSTDVTIAFPTAAQVTFSPTGTVAGNTVQAAIAEVAAEGQPLNANLSNFAGLACTGGLYRIGTNSHACRTPTGQTGVLTITNADGIVGTPAFALATDFINGVSHFAADAGSSDAYAACPQSISQMPSPSLQDGAWFILRVNTANTDAATLNVCTLGAQDLVKLVGGVAVPLATGDLDPQYPVLVNYRSATADWIILSTLKSAGTGGAGTPGGSTTQVQFNSAGAFAGDVDFTFDTATNRLRAGGFDTGDCTTNCTQQAMTATGINTATWAISANYDIAGTTGTKTSGDSTKFDAQGRIVRGGTANKVFQFMLGAENGSVLTDGDDQPSIFYNHYGQGLTINSIWCQSDAGSPTINLQRDDGSPANILSAASMTCATGTGTLATAFSGSENLLATTDRVNLVVVAAGGVAKRITISVRYTLD